MIYILSPLPPKKTGTADYIRLLSRSLKESFGDRYETEIVFCDQLEKNTDCSIGNCIDINDLHIEKEDLIVLTLASNKYHKWIWEFLAQYKQSAHLLSIIHDLSAYGLIYDMVSEGKFNFSYDEWNNSLQTEYGFISSKLVSDGWRLPSGSKYFILAQGLTVSKSDEIFVHSLYAKNCLQTFSVKGVQVPPVTVVGHPIYDLKLNSQMGVNVDKKIFKLGVVGWWSAIKQPELVIRSFWHFYRSLSDEYKNNIKLYFVGNIEKAELLNQKKKLRQIGLDEKVEFVGYVDEISLNSWIKSFDLMFNLRFPSCGETSGTLARAKFLGTRTVTTNFAAFREEYATYHVSVEPRKELLQLIDILQAEWKRWNSGLEDFKLLETYTGDSEEIIKNDIGSEIFRLHESIQLASFS